VIEGIAIKKGRKKALPTIRNGIGKVGNVD
jgi:hypothetical protein